MSNLVSQERSEAYVEIVEILNNMDEKYREKVPLKLRQFFIENASKDYKFHISLERPLEKSYFKDITLNVLAMLNINYWCETEEEKQELIKKYSENEIKYQEQLQEQYNPDNIFKKRMENKTKEEEIQELFEQEEQIIEYKESIFKKFINKIKLFFHIY